MNEKEKISKNKSGISLIVLIITIIIMIILATAVIISLANNGIIGRANKAVEQTNFAQVKVVAETIWAEGYLNEDTPEEIKANIIKAIGGEKVAANYDIQVDRTGVRVSLVNNPGNGNNENSGNNGSGSNGNTGNEGADAEGWIQLYEGSIQTTTQQAELPIAIIPNREYKLTISGAGITEPIECKAVLYPISSSMSVNVLFAIVDGELITFESTADLQAKLEGLDENAKIIAAMSGIIEGKSVIMFDGGTTEYTITKIEIKEAEVFQGGWATIYEGNTAFENGKLPVTNTLIFEQGVKYKLTVESTDYTGSVECVAVPVGSDEMDVGLFKVQNGTASSFASANELAQISATVPIIGGKNITSEEVASYLVLLNTTSEYKITKLEMYLGSQLYEGETILNEGAYLYDYMYTDKIYSIDFTINNERKTTILIGGSFWGAMMLIGAYDDWMFMGGANGLTCINFNGGEDEIILNSVYYLCDSTYIVEENGFVATILDDGTCYLCNTPSGEYVVPETIDGKTISSIAVGYITGTPIFTRPYELDRAEVPINAGFIVRTTDYSFIFEGEMDNFWEDYDYMDMTLDLSEAGDNVEIPTDLLDYYKEKNYGEESITIYVSQAVKNKYPEYTNIKVK